MLVAYLTTDEVNATVAVRLGARHGIIVYPIAPRDLPLDVQTDGMLYDLDFPTSPLREEVLAGLPLLRAAVPSAVHGYSLDGRLARALTTRGVVVARRLGPWLFRRLARALLRAQAPTPRPDGER
jgi:hypothetical protein